MEQVITAQITSSALIAYGIEKLKQSRYFPWITAETTKLNRTLAVVLSGLAAIGIHLQFDSHAGVLIITGLTATGLLHGMWELLRSSAFTQMLYDGVVSRPAAALPAIQQQPAGIAPAAKQP